MRNGVSSSILLESTSSVVNETVKGRTRELLSNTRDVVNRVSNLWPQICIKSVRRRQP